MMQDYPKLLKCPDRVGFTQLDRLFSFTTCKNDLATAATKSKGGLAPECAGSCENDFYLNACQLLIKAGADIHFEHHCQHLAGIEYKWAPKVVLHPEFGVTVEEICSKIKGKVHISEHSTLVIEGDCTLEGDIKIDGICRLAGGKAAHKDIQVTDKKYNKFEEVDPKDEHTPNYLKIRGYKLV